VCSQQAPISAACKHNDLSCLQSHRLQLPASTPTLAACRRRHAHRIPCSAAHSKDTLYMTRCVHIHMLGQGHRCGPRAGCSAADAAHTLALARHGAVLDLASHAWCAHTAHRHSHPAPTCGSLHGAVLPPGLPHVADVRVVEQVDERGGAGAGQPILHG